MNWLRYALMAGIGLVAYLLFLEWNTFQATQKTSNTVVEETLTSYIDDVPVFTPEQTTLTQHATVNDLPSIASEDEFIPTDAIIAPTNAELITVHTDNFNILIDTLGGDIVKLSLVKHKADIDDEDSALELLNRTSSKLYVAQSGLIGPNGTDKSNADRPIYSAERSGYTMSESDESLIVDLLLEQDGVMITKRYEFFRGSYLINVDYLIDNQSASLWRAAPYGQIRRGDFEVNSDVGIGMQPFLGAAITTPETNYKKFKFDKIDDGAITVSNTGGWVALVQHYFISAWVPNQTAKNSYKIRKLRNESIYVLEYSGELSTVEPGATTKIESAFYAGPKDLKALEKISPYLDLTLDFSFLSFIAKPLFLGLVFIQGFVGNWGIAIVLLTMCIKLVFFYPSAMSYRSMAKMRKLQPMMAELKEQYGDDRQKMSSELMKIYKKEKVNPLGGCLPILLQMPVFISLYWALMESVDLRHAPFFLWITDLSVKDPFFVLPLIMGATMFIQQKLNPTPPDPMQAKVMQLMPIFFTVLFLMFPAGLVLYWVVNNTLSIAQQYVITRQIEKAG